MTRIPNYDKWKTTDPTDTGEPDISMAKCSYCWSHTADVEDFGGMYSVVCSKCGLHGPFDQNHRESIRKWNHIRYKGLTDKEEWF